MSVGYLNRGEPGADATLLAAVRAGLEAAADPARAPAMRAYMKSEMPFLGVSVPVVRRVCKALYGAHPLPTFEAWQATDMALWREATYREERYAAVELTGHRLYRAYQRPEALPMYEAMIVTGAWWDLVDGIAVHRVGPMLPRHRRVVEPLLRRWCVAGDLWLRRSAIIAQVTLKERTDTRLLTDCIEPNLAVRDFFIRKAIGWALRSYAWTNPGFVRDYVAERSAELSGLSRREALKNVGAGARA